MNQENAWQATNLDKVKKAGPRVVEFTGRKTTDVIDTMYTMNYNSVQIDAKNYEILELLGKGGFSKCYRIRNKTLSNGKYEEYVLKTINKKKKLFRPGSLDMLHNEIKTH